VPSFCSCTSPLTYSHPLSQVDKDLIAPLQDTWVDGHLASLKEAGRRHDK
jgi:hypothetical protein